MAAAWMHHLSGGAVAVRSAGSAPSGGINPIVTEAMAEVGIELTDAFPKPMTTDIVHASDVIITTGGRRRLPGLPRKALPRLGATRPRGTRSRTSPAHP